jgi:hypothetical protein
VVEKAAARGKLPQYAVVGGPAFGPKVKKKFRKWRVGWDGKIDQAIDFPGGQYRLTVNEKSGKSQYEWSEDSGQ